MNITDIRKENEWKEIFDIINEAITIHDDKFNIVGANNAALELLNTDLDKILQRKCYCCYHNTEAPPKTCPSCETLVTGKYSVTEVYEESLKKYLEVKALPRIDKNNKVIGIVHVVRDISEKKKAEKELLNYKENLEKLIDERTRKLEEINARLVKEISSRENLSLALADKNEELKSIIYSASHDLRSPLVNIQGFCQELKESFASIGKIISSTLIEEESKNVLLNFLNDDIPKSLYFIDNSVLKIEQLLKGLLHLSRLGQQIITITEINMKKLTDNVINSLKFKIKNTDIDILIGDTPNCHGDELLLTQVFINIVDNAIKYKKPDAKLLLNIDGKIKNDFIEYTIKDNGIGIDGNNIPKIFDVFYRENPNGDVKGEGLGLASIRRILDRHGGRVWVESKKGIGSEFHLTLPIKQDANKY